MLKYYTTYKTYFKLIKSVEDDPKVDKKKAARALARFVSFHPHNSGAEDRSDGRALPHVHAGTRSAAGRRRWS